MFILSFKFGSRAEYPQNKNRDWHIPIYEILLKGQSNEIFDLLFVSSIESTFATNQRVEIFLILVKISPSYSNFRVEKTDSLGYQTRRVWLKVE